MGKLQQLRGLVTATARCSGTDAVISSREICLTNPYGTDGSCHEDSGGPVVREVHGVTRLVAEAGTRVRGRVGPNRATKE